VLTRFDDYPIHQTAEPIAHPGTGDRNFYDRYFFNGYSRDADLFFGVAMGLYPNRRVLDASFSVVRGGRQLSLHASRLAPGERGESRVGPLRVLVEEPLRRHRIVVEKNDWGLEADLLFEARTPALEEPRFTYRVGGRVVMDSTRLTQWGAWSGWLALPDQRIPVSPERVLGCRDRSWGVRGVGEREAGAPGPEPQFFWLWAPLHFDDFCTHFAVNEDARGRAWHASGSQVPLLAPGADPAGGDGVVTMASVAHRIRWQPGTRRAAAAELHLCPHAGEPLVIALEPLLCFQMLGLGYLHPEWGHGLWKGESAQGGEGWRQDALAPLDPRHLHVQALVRARCGAREGLGVLEQLVIGPHAPSGFTGLLDGAAERTPG
jgi:hypothetical protein